ncbi:MAG: hypothetical protein LBS42_10500 [Tannerella sp.]|jgi:hypothetical protein|nr:hypothetical protein [Tannerella sp.]
MLYKDTTATELPNETASSAKAANTPPQSGDACHKAFLQQLGLKEIRSGAESLFIPLHGQNWMPDFDDTVAALKQLSEQSKQKTDRALAMLAHVIGKMDKTPPLPRHVVSFMCRDIVTRAVLQRFNETVGCTCTSLRDLSYMTGDNVAEANEMFNTIRYCDPAMRSGRFLAALMNEIIVIKSQLGILADIDGNPLFQYKIVVDGNRLAAMDKKLFCEHTFNPASPESRRIQETFLNEKRICIEKLLYGVDIDPLPVALCRLRLWHDLLKHACWHGTVPCLPSVECNVRCGDALVSRIPAGENLRAVFKRIGYSASDYKKLAKDCKKAKTREEKESLAKIIALIKDKIRHETAWDEKHGEELRKWQRVLEKLKSPSLFAPDAESEKALSEKLHEAELMVNKYRQKTEEAKNSPVYEKAIEWRYEFPELLNGTGDFAGFDALIGYPPDTQKELSVEANTYRQVNYKTFGQTGEVSSLFCELGNKILRPDGFLSFITSSSWMRSIPAGRMRRFLLEETNPLLMLEFEETDKTDRSLPGKGIIVLQKACNRRQLMTCRVKQHQTDLADCVMRHATPMPVDVNGMQTDGTASPFGILTERERAVRNKIEQSGTPLRLWDVQIYPGIGTGCDDAFIIDEKTKDSFVRADYKNSDIIKPLLPDENIRRYTPETSKRWLICIPWHFPLLFDKTITSASRRAEECFAQQYPAIYEHLLRYRDRLVARDVTKAGVAFEWYALQRPGTNSGRDNLAQQKIVWRQEAPAADFCFDYGGCAVLESAGFIVGQHLKYLLGFLNSSLGQYLFRDFPHAGGENTHISILALKALRVPPPSLKIESDIVSLVNRRTSDANPSECEELDRKIDRIVYGICGLTGDEAEFIEKEIHHSH